MRDRLTARRIRHGLTRVRIGNPFAVHDEAVFVGAGGERGFLPPVAGAGGMQRLGLGLPVIKAARQADRFGRRMRELKANGHQWRAGDIIVMVIVFHDDLIGLNNEVFSVY